ncbi:MAG: alkaline phosphatase D family protein [Polyangiales bacterium]
MDRRAFLGTAFAIGCGGATRRPTNSSPNAIKATAKATHGVQVGDVDGDRAVIWARASSPAPMRVTWSDDSGTQHVVEGPIVSLEEDLCGVIELAGLPLGRTIRYSVDFGAEAVQASFRTPGSGDVLFAWSGDTCGQGFGIDRDRGGIKVYDVIRRLKPDFFLHSGDLIYADNPIPETLELPDGSLFRNLTTPETSKVAETLAEFRGRFGYHLLDENVRAFHREVPIVVQWDDHEIHNNWYPGQTLSDPRYQQENKVPVLAQRARRALFEWTPIRRDPKKQIPRVIHRGIVDVFVLDARSFRGPNGPNLEKDYVEPAHFFGPDQLEWLRHELATSKATWKIIACDQPISLMIGDGIHDGVQFHEGIANDDPGPAKGREIEIARLLRFLEEKKIANVIFLTADVHYPSAMRYDASRGKIGPFPSFWEFVAGPLHAGGFGQCRLDPTFGPEIAFQRLVERNNQPPIGVWPSFGSVHVDSKSHALTARLHDGLGAELFSTTLPAV